MRDFLLALYLWLGWLDERAFLIFVDLRAVSNFAGCCITICSPDTRSGCKALVLAAKTLVLQAIADFWHSLSRRRNPLPPDDRALLPFPRSAVSAARGPVQTLCCNPSGWAQDNPTCRGGRCSGQPGQKWCIIGWFYSSEQCVHLSHPTCSSK